MKLELLLVLLVFQSSYAFLLDGESDKACEPLDRHNITLQMLVEHETNLCESVNTHFQNHNAELLMHKDSILHMTATIADLTARLNKLEQDPTRSLVAFSTILTNNLGAVAEGTKIIFDHVTVNTGGGYDVHNGVFTAPVSGAFHFSMSMASPATSHFFLMKNGQNVEYTFSGQGNFWSTTSVSAVMELHNGDRVWVEADGSIYGYSGYQRPGHTDHLYLHTGFMGFLIN